MVKEVGPKCRRENFCHESPNDMYSSTAIGKRRTIFFYSQYFKATAVPICVDSGNQIINCFTCSSFNKLLVRTIKRFQPGVGV